MKRGKLGWRALATAVVVALLLVVLDPYVTRIPGRGLCPADASWVIFSSDFPSFYADLLKSDFAAAMSEDAPDYQASWQLNIRKTTGIRPTPLRWRMWLGRSYLWSTSPEGSGTCVRPGLLLKFVDAVAGIGGERPRVRQFGPYYYGWRGGYLVFSTSEKYVLSSLDAEIFIPKPQRGGQLWVFEGRAGRSAIGITAGPRLTISGWVEGSGLHSRTQKLSLASWPLTETMAWGASSRPGDLALIAKSLQALVLRNSHLAEADWYQKLMQLAAERAEKSGVATMPADWDSTTDESALVLFDLDGSETLPVPEVGLVLRQQRPAEGPHPLDPLAADGPVMPYEWQGRPGKLVSLAGEKFTLCLTSEGNDWLAASQEPVMARLLDAMKEVNPAELDAPADATVCLNWSKLSSSGIALARKWAALGALPGVDKEGVEQKVAPLARVLGKLGFAKLGWREHDGVLHFNGVLTAGGAQ